VEIMFHSDPEMEIDNNTRKGKIKVVIKTIGKDKIDSPEREKRE